MTPAEITQGMLVLRNYYGKDGKPYGLNDTQVAAYLDALSPFDAQDFTAAAKQWIATSRWFPAVSDLLGLLRPPVDPAVAAHLAWTTFERSLRRAGAYRGATFVDGAIGETARQVFGSFAAACQFDLDSPGWAIRRQSFLAVYPTFHGRASGPVTLYGLHRDETPLLIGHVEGLPQLAGDVEPMRELTASEATAALADVTARHLARTRSEGR